jgi:hypothetical protein
MNDLIHVWALQAPDSRVILSEAKDLGARGTDFP